MNTQIKTKHIWIFNMEEFDDFNELIEAMLESPSQDIWDIPTLARFIDGEYYDTEQFIEALDQCGWEKIKENYRNYLCDCVDDAIATGVVLEYDIVVED